MEGRWAESGETDDTAAYRGRRVTVRLGALGGVATAFSGYHQTVIEMAAMCRAIDPFVRPYFTADEAEEFDMLDRVGEFEYAFEVASLVKAEHEVQLPESLLEEVKKYLLYIYRTPDLKIDRCYPEIDIEPLLPPDPDEE